MDLRYVLGLDIGIASVGWAVLTLDDNDEPYKIEALNSRIFEKAENPKDGSSLAAPRREARSVRRRLRRRRHRSERVRHLLVREGVLSAEEAESLCSSTIPKNVARGKGLHALRYEGLDRKLSSVEWSRVLLYFAKHRGFKSNRKNGTADKEEGRVLQAIADNMELLSKYRSAGEMLYLDERFKARKRNASDDYKMTISREMLLKEIRSLFASQRNYGNPYASKDFEEAYTSIFLSQRNFDEGPGEGSPYAGNQIEKMIGKCTLEEEELRAPKASYSFMRFNLLQKLSHIRIREKAGERALTEEEIKRLESLAWSNASLNYGHFRKELGLADTDRFADVYYRTEDFVQEEKKNKIKITAAYHEIAKALKDKGKEYISTLSIDQLDAIAYAFSAYKSDGKIREYMQAKGVLSEDVDLLLANLSGFSKFGHISIKACRKLIPYLEKGMGYIKACEVAGYKDKVIQKKKTLSGNIEEVQEIPNPVVKRAVSQTIKVINAIVRKYGSPVEIHIELAREMARSKTDRDAMTSSMEKNRAENEKIKKELMEKGLLSPKGLDIVKWKLYKEQQGVCAYSQKVIDVDRLLHEGTYAEVDHILPYSRSFDDSYRNKVLVLTEENRRKGNRTPMEYFADMPERKHAFVTWCKGNIRDFKKREHLLKENYDREDAGWKDRHLNDTRYITKLVKDIIEKYLEMAPFKTSRKRHVVAVNGAVTAYVRKRLGIAKIREDGDLHHAVDAAVIACVTEGMINRISRYSKRREILYNNKLVDEETGEIIKEKEDFPKPWPWFRKELDARTSKNPALLLREMKLPTYTEAELENLREPYVSRMPYHKVRGAGHEAKIRSPRLLKDGKTAIKTPLVKLNLTNDETKIAGYVNPESDKLLYDALYERLCKFGGKAEKAFAEPFYKPKADGGQGPLVKSVKISKLSTMNVELNKGNGIADNERRVRVDVFYVSEGKKKGYYLVPIYVADTLKSNLPMKAVVAKKAYDYWENMRLDDFIFSLQLNDMVYIENERGINCSLINKKSTLQNKISIKKGFFYYRGMDIHEGNICFEDIDGVYKGRVGVKTLKCLRKVQIDILGEIRNIGKEKRQGFSHMKRTNKRKRE